MQFFFVLLTGLITSVIVFLTAYFLLKRFLEDAQKQKLLELKFKSKELITPIRLQAYERLAMYLERINPNSLIMRTNNSNLTVSLYQTLLVNTIRNEFEHNLSQQVYVSHQVWESLKMAKEETIRIINLSAARLSPTAPSIELSSKILEISATEIPSDKALKMLKDEIQMFY